MAGEYVFNLQGLTKMVDGRTILDDVNLAFFFGAKIGVIGGNGSGKTSLLRIMAGQDQEYMGDLLIAKNRRIGYLEQEPLIDMNLTVGEVVAQGIKEQQALIDRYDEICELLSSNLSPAEEEKLNNELGDLQETIDHNDLWEIDHTVEMAMEALRLPPPEQPISQLSGGERRRVALCRLLLQNPDIMLLDEPTNHLDTESVGWLEEHLKRFEGTLIVVTHDRYFLSNVTEWILEMDAGHTYPYKGNYEAWLEQKQHQMNKQVKMAASRKKLLTRELEWVRMNASARHKKSKARIRRYDELASKEFDAAEENLVIQIPSGKRLGTQVVEAQNITKIFGDKLIMEKVCFSLPPGGIVGVIGGNGAGKTTLFNMITGTEKPTHGNLTIGKSVDISHVDQMRDALSAEHTVYEEISGGEDTIELGGKTMNARAYCARFNFKGADQQKKVGLLSGGERNRVHLAKLLRTGGNLLLLDEPTNDLDVSTLRSLEDGLINFGGCAVVISHDRWFLDRIATHILAFEGESEVNWFEGNYQEYHLWRQKIMGADAVKPKRIQFRPVRH